MAASRADKKKLRPFLRSWRRTLKGYFFGTDPGFGLALLPMLLVSVVLYTRHPLKTNFIFDEQEALLANPYVRSTGDLAHPIGWLDAFKRDFWGLSAERTVGSYRPIPNLIWRALWALGARDQSPFLHHFVNVLMHGVNAALLVALVFRVTCDRALAWVAGLAFATAAISTEAVSGVVGIADVLGLMACLLGLAALQLRLPWMPIVLALAMLLGLYTKESVMSFVVLVPIAAWTFAPQLHLAKPRPFLRGIAAAAVSFGTFVLYVETRKRWFLAARDPHVVNAYESAADWPHRAFYWLLKWYAQPNLPHDPLNNPLVNASAPLRIAGALRVYARGLGQIVFPWRLSGDYSSPQEPVPDRVVFPESVIGAALIVVPALIGIVLILRGRARAARSKRSLQTTRLDPIEVGNPGAIVPPPSSSHVIPPAPPSSARALPPPPPSSRPAPPPSSGRAIAPPPPSSRPAPSSSRPAPPPSMPRSLAPAPPSSRPEPPPSGRELTSFDPPSAATPLAMPVRAVDLVASRNQRAHARSVVLLPDSDPRASAAPLLGYAMLWVLAFYLPVSNIPVLLPTVRAERFWYFPIAGTSIIIAWMIVRFMRFAREHRLGWLVVAIATPFFAFQSFAARSHANDYSDDLAFWDATRRAVPNSAKAHLNYSVMQGARGRLDLRLISSRRALDLAPEWPMASVYLGDTLCRMHRSEEAWPHYKRGFAMAVNDVNLIALGLQCLWDEHAVLSPYPDEDSPAPVASAQKPVASASASASATTAPEPKATALPKPVATMAPQATRSGKNLASAAPKPDPKPSPQPIATTRSPKPSANNDARHSSKPAASRSAEPKDPKPAPRDADATMDVGLARRISIELAELSAKHPHTWLSYLADDILLNGQDNGGVDQKYRPRGYNEGPRWDK